MNIKNVLNDTRSYGISLFFYISNDYEKNKRRVYWQPFPFRLSMCSEYVQVTKFRLDTAQAESFRWLKAQGLNCDDDTLNYWARTYPIERLQDVIQYAKLKRANGYVINNLGGWVHSILKKGVPIANATTERNRRYAQEFASLHQWSRLKFYEMYVRDVVTNDEVSLTINPDDFTYALDGLYRRSLLDNNNA